MKQRREFATGTEAAQYIARTGAANVHSVVAVVAASADGAWRYGIVALGAAANIRGGNNLKTRPVETACRLELLEEIGYAENHPHRARWFGITALGRDMLAAFATL